MRQGGKNWVGGKKKGVLVKRATAGIRNVAR